MAFVEDYVAISTDNFKNKVVTQAYTLALSDIPAGGSKEIQFGHDISFTDPANVKGVATIDYQIDGVTVLCEFGVTTDPDTDQVWFNVRAHNLGKTAITGSINVHVIVVGQ